LRLAAGEVPAEILPTADLVELRVAVDPERRGWGATETGHRAGAAARVRTLLSFLRGLASSEGRRRDIMDEPWQIYYEELVLRTEGIEDQQWNREGDVREAAHEAYRATVDRLVEHLDYEDEDA